MQLRTTPCPQMKNLRTSSLIALGLSLQKDACPQYKDTIPKRVHLAHREQSSSLKGKKPAQKKDNIPKWRSQPTGGNGNLLLLVYYKCVSVERVNTDFFGELFPLWRVGQEDVLVSGGYGIVAFMQKTLDGNK